METFVSICWKPYPFHLETVSKKWKRFPKNGYRIQKMDTVWKRYPNRLETPQNALLGDVQSNFNLAIVHCNVFFVFICNLLRRGSI